MQGYQRESTSGAILMCGKWAKNTISSSVNSKLHFQFGPVIRLSAMAFKGLLLVGLLIVATSARSSVQKSQKVMDEREEIRDTDDDLRDYGPQQRSRTRVLSESIPCSKRPSVVGLGNGDEVILTSPRFPKKYTKNTKCGWKFYALASEVRISVECDYFMLEKMKRRRCPDFLQIWGRKYCGGFSNRPTRYTSPGRFLSIRFRSGRRRQYRGFTCRATGTFPVTPTFSNTNCALCGVPNRSSRIVNGNVAEENEYPWMVALAQRGTNDSQNYCGGSIINERWVLTAAHCPVTLNDQVIVGAHDFNNPPAARRRINIISVIRYPYYNSNNKDNDIALIELSESLDLSNTAYAPICLPLVNDSDAYALQNAIVTGWGITVNGTDSYATELMEAALYINSNGFCQSRYGDEADITDNMICASNNQGADTCEGDTGGPLIKEKTGPNKYFQIGVASFGTDCGNVGLPGGYARVTRFTYWIERNIGSNGYCT